MKVKLTIEVELEEAMTLFDDDERIWAENDVFTTDGSLVLWSNEIGDSVGSIINVEDLEWDEDTINEDFSN